MYRRLKEKIFSKDSDEQDVWGSDGIDEVIRKWVAGEGMEDEGMELRGFKV